jgi:hypothetical protein
MSASAAHTGGAALVTIQLASVIDWIANTLCGMHMPNDIEMALAALIVTFAHFLANSLSSVKMNLSNTKVDDDNNIPAKQ